MVPVVKTRGEVGAKRSFPSFDDVVNGPLYLDRYAFYFNFTSTLLFFLSLHYPVCLINGHYTI
jgi:hypothetical protein